MNIIDFLILSLAAWRLSSLLVNEDGPFDLLAKLRARAGVQLDAYGRPGGNGFWAGLLSCVWCVSVWVGLALCPFVYFGLVYLLLPLALSAAAILFEERIING